MRTMGSWSCASLSHDQMSKINVTVHVLTCVASPGRSDNSQSGVAPLLLFHSPACCTTGDCYSCSCHRRASHSHLHQLDNLLPVPFSLHQQFDRRSGNGPQWIAHHRAVVRIGPSLVTTTVCSYAAATLPSCVVSVQPSAPVTIRPDPSATCGSMVITSPSRRRSRAVRR